MSLGEKIKIARKQVGLSQQELAEKIGVSRSAVAKWEANKGIPDIDNLKVLSRLLGITIDNLVNEGHNLEGTSIKEETAPGHSTGNRKKKLITVGLLVGIICTVGLVFGFMLDTAVVEDMKAYTVSSEINSLYLNIDAADITIRNGDAFAVESNLKHLTVKDENGRLTVKDIKRPFGNYNNAKLVITIPWYSVLETAELKVGAGRLSVGALSAKILDCDFGAGEVNISELYAYSSANIDGGVGKIVISGGSINELDFDMGVGELDFTSLLVGDCSFNLGTGESDIVLLGSKADYVLDINKGVGEISVDGGSFSSPSSGNRYGTVKINGGVGNVNIAFLDIDE